MEHSRRLLEILFRAVRGEELSVRKIADTYGVSTKSVSRDISKIKVFLAENSELVGHAELDYNYATKAYRLSSDEFLTDREMFAVAKVILGVRAFSGMDAAGLIEKFKKFTTAKDRKMLEEIVRKELYHYAEVKHDCDNVTETLWRLVNALHSKREVTLRYYKKDRMFTEKRIQPVSLIFMDFYFYLIAYYPGQYEEPRYYRVDRIKDIVEHRKTFDAKLIPNFDEGLLRKRCQFMFYGRLRTIRFSYTGPSVQAILDKLPTAKIVERKRGEYVIEAETHGDGIKMFLLSQGAWVKVLAPEEFVREMGAEARAVAELYR
jgi:predicted DNA-binding transcriptional regulator YafY